LILHVYQAKINTGIDVVDYLCCKILITRSGVVDVGHVDVVAEIINQ